MPSKYNHPDAVSRIIAARAHHVFAEERQQAAKDRGDSATLRDCGHRHTDNGNDRCYDAQVAA